MKVIAILISSLFFSFPSKAQVIITDDITHVFQSIQSLYEKEMYQVEKTVMLKDVKGKKEKTIALNCYTGKKLLIAAVFDTKPANPSPDCSLLIYKKINAKTQIQPFVFAPVQFNAAINCYYSLLQLQFPPEANIKNCACEIKVDNADTNSNAIGFIIMSK